jgi:hypothetical protein
MNKENWIEEVLQSTDGIQRAVAPAHMADRAWAGVRMAARPRPGLLRTGIAAAVVILAVNVGTVVHMIRQKPFPSGSTPSETIESTSIYTY